MDSTAETLIRLAQALAVSMTSFLQPGNRGTNEVHQNVLLASVILPNIPWARNDNGSRLQREPSTQGNGRNKHFEPGILSSGQQRPHGLQAPPNLIGTELSAMDFAALESRWVERPLAESAFLRRVDLWTGAQLVERKGGDYAGIAIPYFAPGDQHVREYRLRRDHPDL